MPDNSHLFFFFGELLAVEKTRCCNFLSRSLRMLGFAIHTCSNCNFVLWWTSGVKDDWGDVRGFLLLEKRTVLFAHAHVLPKCSDRCARNPPNYNNPLHRNCPISYHATFSTFKRHANHGAHRDCIQNLPCGAGKAQPNAKNNRKCGHREAEQHDCSHKDCYQRSGRNCYVHRAAIWQPRVSALAILAPANFETLAHIFTSCWICIQL